MSQENNQFLKPPSPLSPLEKINQNKRISDPFPGVAHWLNLQGKLVTLTTIPTTAPKAMSDSVVIYIDDLTTPTVKRLYIYSREAGIWNYVTLT